MSQPTRLLEERVTQLEAEMADVRFLATKADREVSDVQITLRGYTGTLNAIRDDQVEQGKRLARVEKKVDTLGKKVDSVEQRVGGVEQKIDNVEQRIGGVEQKVDNVEKEMRHGFALLGQGQERITELLTRHLGEPDEETSAGGADE